MFAVGTLLQCSAAAVYRYITHSVLYVKDCLKLSVVLYYVLLSTSNVYARISVSSFFAVILGISAYVICF